MVNALYTAVATAVGDGRNGEVHSSDGVIDEKLAVPKELGGPGGLHTNPEQLFAAGFAACFHSALKVVAARTRAPLPDGTSITAEVDIGHGPGGAYQLGVRLDAHLPGLPQDKADELVAAAHRVCPYSNATRGNIDVALSTTT